MKDANNSERATSQKSLGKSKNEKPSNTKNVSVAQVKKGKDEKDVGAPPSDSNGSIASHSQPKLPLKSNSFSEMQVQASKVPMHLV